MLRDRGYGLLLTSIALAATIASRPTFGQTLSFLHSLTGGASAL